MSAAQISLSFSSGLHGVMVNIHYSGRSYNVGSWNSNRFIPWVLYCFAWFCAKWCLPLHRIQSVPSFCFTPGILMMVLLGSYTGAQYYSSSGPTLGLSINL